MTVHSPLPGPFRTQTSPTCAPASWRPAGQTRKRLRIVPGRAAGELQELVRYWTTDYDWRKAEAQLNELPQYVTNDRRRRHSLHLGALHHPNAMPLIMTHGWPGSVFEFIEVIGPLADPAAHGGNAADDSI